MFSDQLSDESKRWLHTAIVDGIVDVRLGPFDDDNFPIGLFPLLRGWHDQGLPSKESPELYTDRRSRSFKESVLSRQTHTDIDEHWAIELARIIVPYGDIGFLECIEQVLADVDGSYYPTSSEFWGNPYSQLSDINNCRWYLKVQPVDTFDGQRINFQSATVIDPYQDLPGAPYAEKFEIDGIWYPAHCGQSRNLKMIIPQDTVLRFYMITPPTILYQWVAAGRLRAFTQSTFSPEAAQNARKTY